MKRIDNKCPNSTHWHGRPVALRRSGEVARYSIIAVIVIGLNACVAPARFTQYQETIQAFQEATDKTAKVTTAYLVDLNNYERRLELDRLRADPNRILNIPANFLASKFDPDAIYWRVQAFEVLRSFTSLLAALADSDAPDRWKASAKKLQSNTEGLLKTIEGAEVDIGKTAAFVGPLTSIITMIGQDYINSRREKALSTAIANAAPAIHTISDLLKRDMETVIVQRARTLNEPLIDIAGEYETVQAKPMSDARERKRLAILDDLQGVLEHREASLLTLQGLSTSMAAFDEALSALETYAKTSQDSRDLADVIATVARYGAAADTLLSAFEDSSE